MPAAQMIATHLNAPYGRVVSASDVVASLREGRLSAASKSANEILAALFVEVEPRLILRCAEEEGVPISAVQKLYVETLREGLMPVPAWERAATTLSGGAPEAPTL
jgi:hypothetical protein